jgi:hypothetical protein
MTREKGVEPVGINAPVDMADITPLGTYVVVRPWLFVPFGITQSLNFERNVDKVCCVANGAFDQ